MIKFKMIYLWLALTALFLSREAVMSYGASQIQIFVSFKCSVLTHILESSIRTGMKNKKKNEGVKKMAD